MAHSCVILRGYSGCPTPTRTRPLCLGGRPPDWPVAPGGRAREPRPVCASLWVGLVPCSWATDTGAACPALPACCPSWPLHAIPGYGSRPPWDRAHARNGTCDSTSTARACDPTCRQDRAPARLESRALVRRAGAFRAETGHFARKVGQNAKASKFTGPRGIARLTHARNVARPLRSAKPDTE